MKLIYPAVFKRLEEQKGFCVTVPDLKGCVTQGKDLTEAIDMIIDAASGYILDELEDGNSIPPASDIETNVLSHGEFSSLIVLDMDSYAEKFGENAIRKNCTIPKWLNTIAEKNNINFSQTLQEALLKKVNM